MEPGFPYDVGKFLKEIVFQEPHASAQSDQHLLLFTAIDSRIPNLAKSKISML